VYAPDPVLLAQDGAALAPSPVIPPAISVTPLIPGGGNPDGGNPGDPNPPARHSLDANGYRLTINEAYLPGGSEAGDADSPLSSSLRFGISSNDGLAAISINGQRFDVEDGALTGFPEKMNGAAGTLSNPKLIDTGDGTWTLSFTYTQTAAYSHAAGGGRNTAVDADAFTLTVAGKSGVSAAASAYVDIIDDVPVAESETGTATWNDEVGAWIANGDILENDKYGADGKHASHALKVEGQIIAGGESGTEIDGFYGKLTIYADGHYTYQLNPETNPNAAPGMHGIGVQGFSGGTYIDPNKNWWDSDRSTSVDLSDWSNVIAGLERAADMKISRSEGIGLGLGGSEPSTPYVPEESNLDWDNRRWLEALNGPKVGEWQEGLLFTLPEDAGKKPVVTLHAPPLNSQGSAWVHVFFYDAEGNLLNGEQLENYWDQDVWNISTNPDNSGKLHNFQYAGDAIVHSILVVCDSGQGVWVQGINGAAFDTAPPPEVFNYTITDSDGDTADATLTIDLGNVRAAPPSFTLSGEVDESKLDGGTGLGAGDACTTVHTFDELPEGWSIVPNGDGYSGGHGVIAYDGENWRYTLTSPVTDPDPEGAHNQPGRGEKAQDTVEIKVQDVHGNQFDLNVTIDIHDDAPLDGAAEMRGVEGVISGGNAPAGAITYMESGGEYKLTFNFGADGPHATEALSFNGINGEGTTDLTVSNTGSAVTLTQNYTNGVLTVLAVDESGNDVATLTISKDGTWSFAQYQPLAHFDAGKVGLEDTLTVFGLGNLIIKDADGDTATIELSMELGDAGPQVLTVSSTNVAYDAQTGTYQNATGGVSFDYGADEFKKITFADEQGHSYTFTGKGEWTYTYSSEDTLKVSVDSSGNLTYIYTPATNSSGGEHTFTVTAYDSDGDSVTQTFGVEVASWTPPTMISLSSHVFDESFLSYGSTTVESAEDEHTFYEITIPSGYEVDTSATGWQHHDDGSFIMQDPNGYGVLSYSNGRLTYTLTNKASHPTPGDAPGTAGYDETLADDLSITLPLKHSLTGKQTTGTFTFNIHDDGLSDVSLPDVEVPFAEILPKYDIALCLDVSGSMLYKMGKDEFPTGWSTGHSYGYVSRNTAEQYQQTRMYAIQVAALNMLKAYADQAGEENIQVTLSFFGMSASSNNLIMSYTDAKRALSCLYAGFQVTLNADGTAEISSSQSYTPQVNPSSGTNYTAGLKAMTSALQALIADGRVNGDYEHQLRAYFMSDGDPQKGDESSADWTAYFTGVLSKMSNFDLNVVGLNGTNMTFTSLDAIDGVQGNNDVIYIPGNATVEQIVSKLVATVGLAGQLPMPVSADGVSVARVAFLLDGDEAASADYIPQTDANGWDLSSGVNGEKGTQVITLPYGKFTFFADGSYKFEPDAEAVNGAKTEIARLSPEGVSYTFQVTYKDGDGDTLTKDFTYRLKGPGRTVFGTDADDAINVGGSAKVNGAFGDVVSTDAYASNGDDVIVGDRGGADALSAWKVAEGAKATVTVGRTSYTLTYTNNAIQADSNANREFQFTTDGKVQYRTVGNTSWTSYPTAVTWKLENDTVKPYQEHLAPILEAYGNDTIIAGLGDDLVFGDALNAAFLLDSDWIKDHAWTPPAGLTASSAPLAIVHAYMDATHTKNGSPAWTADDLHKFIENHQEEFARPTNAFEQGGHDTLLGDVPPDNAELNGLHDENGAVDAEVAAQLADAIDALGDVGGNDTLYGGAGNDALFGGAGDDKLYGGPGDDVLYGGRGNDYLDGGEGRDSLYGGPGNDIILYDPADAVIDGGEGLDFLTGLTTAQLDALMKDSGQTLNSLLTNGRVSGIEALVAGEASAGLTSLTDLEDKGVTLVADGEGVEKIAFGVAWTATSAPVTLDGHEYALYQHSVDSGDAYDLQILVAMDHLSNG
jgi:Ca2+-binding RTX toxin-like protein